jgi:hypothetical protein
LTSKSDLELGGRDAGDTYDTSSYYSDYLWQVFTKSFGSMKKLWTGHKIYSLTDYVDLWPPSVTLTLEVGDQLLRMTHHLIIVNNCGKHLQNPFKDKKVMDRTWHIPSNRQCWHWMSKCYLDPGGMGLVVVHETSSYYNKHFCQVISDSFDKWQSYGTAMKVWWTGRRMDRWTDRAYFYIPLFSSKRQGTVKHFIDIFHCYHLFQQ